MKQLLVILLLVGSAFLVAGCGGRSSSVDAGEGGGEEMAEQARYLKYNFHYEPDRMRGSQANWVRLPDGQFLPANTKVRFEDAWGNAFNLIAVEKGLTVSVEYKPNRSGGLSAREYFDLITSPEPVSYDELSAVDQKGIEQGKAYEGMTKKGVMAALGYPMHMATASLEANTWTYWHNRFSKLEYVFGPDGKLKRVP